MTRKQPDMTDIVRGLSRESSLDMQYEWLTAAMTLLVSKALRGVEPSRWTHGRAVQIGNDVRKMVERYRVK